MQFLLTRRATQSVRPDAGAYARVGEVIHEMLGAGVLVAADAVLPNSVVRRVSITDGKQTVNEGTFDGSPGFDAFVLIDVRSQDEAMKWSGRLAAGHSAAEFEVRQMAEMSKAASPEVARETLLSARAE